ncbi:MAG: hypothetical protein KDB00_20355 [Planctomycetales bacterium]|nr:hypothetical protein [Planctomycetales bacterium]
MRRQGLILLAVSLPLVLIPIVYAQLPTEEQPDSRKSPVPPSMQCCWAQLNDGDESLELLLPAHQEIKSQAFYDVSLPIDRDGRREYRTERRHHLQTTVRVRFARCSVDLRQIAVFRANGERLTSEDIKDQLKQPTSVVLSESLPNDLLQAVLAENCLVIVVPNRIVNFQLPGISEN